MSSYHFVPEYRGHFIVPWFYNAGGRSGKDAVPRTAVCAEELLQQSYWLSGMRHRLDPRPSDWPRRAISHKREAREGGLAPGLLFCTFPAVRAGERGRGRVDERRRRSTSSDDSVESPRR